MTKKKIQYLTEGELIHILQHNIAPSQITKAINAQVSKNVVKAAMKKKPSTSPAMIEVISNFYKEKINRQEMASGKRNLAKLLQTVEHEVVFQAVQNYYETLKATGKLGTEYTIRFRNFVGREKRYEDYIEMPELGESLPNKGPSARQAQIDKWAESDEE